LNQSPVIAQDGRHENHLQLLLAGIVLMLVNACANYPRSGPAAFTGT